MLSPGLTLARKGLSELDRGSYASPVPRLLSPEGLRDGQPCRCEANCSGRAGRTPQGCLWRPRGAARAPRPEVRKADRCRFGAAQSLWGRVAGCLWNTDGTVCLWPGRGRVPLWRPPDVGFKPGSRSWAPAFAALTAPLGSESDSAPICPPPMEDAG